MRQNDDWQKIRPKTGGELATRQLEERIPWITPLLVPGYLGMVYAKAGIGKSYFCLWLAGAAAAGVDFLKWKTERRANVLYVDGEMGEHELQERYWAMQSMGQKESLEHRFCYLTPDDFDAYDLFPPINKPWGQKYYDGLILERGFDVLIFDNIGCLTEKAKGEGETETWDQTRKWLKKHRKNGRCIVLVHHAGKSGDQLGTSQKEQPLNWILKLSQPVDYEEDQGARFDVTYHKGRGLDKSGFTAWYQTLDGKTQWLWADAKSSRVERVQEMKRMKMKDLDIAEALGISIYRMNRIWEDVKNKQSAITEAERMEPRRDEEDDLFGGDYYGGH